MNWPVHSNAAHHDCCCFLIKPQCYVASVGGVDPVTSTCRHSNSPLTTGVLVLRDKLDTAPATLRHWCSVLKLKEERALGLYCWLPCDQFHLPSQSAHKKTQSRQKAHTHKLKNTNLWAPRELLKNMSAMFDIIHSCSFHWRIDKSFPCSRCVIYVSCNVHLISTTTTVRKGSWTFLPLLRTNQRSLKIR